jgi:hypothetical protein
MGQVAKKWGGKKNAWIAGRLPLSNLLIKINNCRYSQYSELVSKAELYPN